MRKQLFFIYTIVFFGFPSFLNANLSDPFLTQRSVSITPGKHVISAAVSQKSCSFEKISSPLGLPEAVDRALCNNQKTVQAWANVKSQASLVGVAKASYLPTVTGSLGATKSKDETSVKGFPELDSKTSPTTQNGGIALKLLLFDFGQRDAKLKSLQLLLDAANSTQNATLQTVFAETAKVYYQAQTASTALQSKAKAVNYTKESFLAAEAKYKAGVGLLIDKLKAQTAYAQAISNRVKAEGDLQISIGNLAISLGLPVNTPLALDPHKPQLPDTSFVQSVDNLIEEAKHRHPSIVAAQAQLQAAEAQVEAIKAQGLPSISLSSEIDFNNTQGQEPYDTSGHTMIAGLHLSVPLFEGFERLYRVQTAKADFESKAVELADTKQQVSLNVWTSYQSLRTETENLKATDDLVYYAKQSFQMAKGRYKAGTGDFTDLLDSQKALSDAELQHITAWSNWLTERITLVANIGKLGMWAIQ